MKKRQELVRRFQEDEAVPFFVLSLKAGGTGLNLTAASHVVHFDRWWNPAVENQATDRAFRIGQKKNVLVHKFVCRGTVEEKIDALIESKQQLSRDVLEGGAERLLTEMRDDEILDLVALDLRAAAAGEASDGLAAGARYVSAAERRRGRPRAMSNGFAKKGRGVSPVVVEGRDHRPHVLGQELVRATSSATATSRTACRAGGPTSGTAPSSTSRSHGGR